MRSKILFFFLIFHSQVFPHSHIATDHAPIGVMGEHTHAKGELMVSYRYMNMFMDDNRIGNIDVDNGTVLNSFPVTPTDMTMQMHMIGLMYGLTHRLTLTAMGSYITSNMNHVNRMGGEFETQSQGFGDTSVGALYSLISSNEKQMNLILGSSVSIPSGSINRRDDLPIGNQLILPFPMQLGSGTYDVQVQLTFTKNIQDFNLGAQIRRVQRIGNNNRDYRLGDTTAGTIWGALNLDPNFSISLRAAYTKQENIDGTDLELNPLMVSTARADLRAFERAEGFVGINYLMKSGQRLAFEFGTPFYQFVDGPQLRTDYQLNLGWQYVF